MNQKALQKAFKIATVLAENGIGFTLTVTATGNIALYLNEYAYSQAKELMPKTFKEKLSKHGRTTYITDRTAINE